MSSPDGTAITYDVNELNICEPPGVQLPLAGRSCTQAVPPLEIMCQRSCSHPADDFFNYWPSLALAITALCLYAVAAVVIGFMTERRKVYRFVHCIT